MVTPYSKHYLRFPIVFGGVLLAFAVGFSYRREIFSKDIEAVREENKLNEEKWIEKAEEIKRLSREHLERRKEKKMAER